MIIVSGSQNNKADIRNLWDECFDEDSVEWRNWYFENIYDEKNVIYGKENKELVSMIHMNPYKLFLRGSKISAFALAGVATKKEYRNQGFADKLMKYALKKAYEAGYDFSFLYPFNYEFYQKYGYMLSYYKYEYKYIANSDSKELIKTKEFSPEMFAKIYSRFVKGKNGFVIRDAEYFKIHLKELLCDNNELLCFYIGSRAGYLTIDKDKHKVQELVYEGDIAEAIKSISTYYKKNLIFENLYDTENMINIKEKHCMARIISVEKIFKKIKLKDCDVKLEIKDQIIKENNGLWHIKSKNGITEINKIEDSFDFSIDISVLAPVITGLTTEHNQINEIQNILFNSTQPYIYEVC